VRCVESRLSRGARGGGEGRGDAERGESDDILREDANRNRCVGGIRVEWESDEVPRIESSGLGSGYEREMTCCDFRGDRMGR
jgi:hypothetical protein